MMQRPERIALWSNRCAGSWQRTQWLLRSSALICVIFAIGACSKPGPSPQALTGDLADATYGEGVQPNPAVTYQPDVILVGGGAKSIRAASADGLVWVIDGHAAHAQDLRPGKIMIATSRAAGRIMSIEPRGEDLAVTLGPMQLADVLRDADITLDHPFNLSTMVIQAVPDVPYRYRNYDAAAGAPPPHVQTRSSRPSERTVDRLIRLIPVQVAAAGTTTPMDQLPAAGKSMGKISVSDWEFELTARSDNPLNLNGGGKLKQRIGLKIQRSLSKGKGGRAGLKAGIDVGVYVSDLRFKTRTVYHDGKLDQETSSVLLEGLEGLDVNISTGIEKAIGDNQRVRIEIPLEFAEPCPFEGIPMMCQVKFKFLIETALGGSNATLSGDEKFDLEGDLGLAHGEMVLPVANATHAIAETIQGLSMGVSGLVFTFETRFMTGFGVPAYFMGPYAKFVVATGITHAAGVSFGFSQDCHASTVKIDAGVGWGLQVASSELAVLKDLLKGVKFDTEAYEVLQTFYRRDAFVPDLKICHF